MTTPEPTTAPVGVSMSETASLLAEHYTHISGRGLTTVCKCGEVLGERTGPALGMSNLHRAHLAAILDAHFAERERALVERAWDDGFMAAAAQDHTAYPRTRIIANPYVARPGDGVESYLNRLEQSGPDAVLQERIDAIRAARPASEGKHG